MSDLVIAGANSTFATTEIAGAPFAVLDQAQTMLAFIDSGGGVFVVLPQGPQGPKGAPGSSLPWTDLTANATLITGNNYRANSASLLTLTLPTANFGDPPIFIQGWGTGLWKLLGSGAILGGDNTASFTTYVESNNQYDSVWLYPQGGTAYAVAPVGGSLLTSV